MTGPAADAAGCALRALRVFAGFLTSVSEAGKSLIWRIKLFERSLRTVRQPAKPANTRKLGRHERPRTLKKDRGLADADPSPQPCSRNSTRHPVAHRDTLSLDPLAPQGSAIGSARALPCAAAAAACAGPVLLMPLRRCANPVPRPLATMRYRMP